MKEVKESDGDKESEVVEDLAVDEEDEDEVEEGELDDQVRSFIFLTALIFLFLP